MIQRHHLFCEFVKTDIERYLVFNLCDICHLLLPRNQHYEHLKVMVGDNKDSDEYQDSDGGGKGEFLPSIREASGEMLTATLLGSFLSYLWLLKSSTCPLKFGHKSICTRVF